MAVVLEQSTLDRLRRIGGDKLLRAMLASFASTGAERIATASAAAEAGDGAGVADAAHALKSSAGNVGATELLELAARVEREARGAGADLCALAAALAAGFDDARTAAAAAAADAEQGTG